MLYDYAFFLRCLKSLLPKDYRFFEQYNQLEKELHEAYPKNVDFKNGLFPDENRIFSGGDSWRRSENWRYNEDEDEDYRRGDRDFDRRRREEEREERDERRPGTSRDERTEVHRRGDAEGVKITKQQLQHLFM